MVHDELYIDYMSDDGFADSYNEQTRSFSRCHNIISHHVPVVLVAFHEGGGGESHHLQAACLAYDCKSASEHLFFPPLPTAAAAARPSSDRLQASSSSANASARVVYQLSTSSVQYVSCQAC